MDIRNFITFNTIVEEEGFTRAAEKLNYAQSSVTAHIKELENHYGEMLFDRIGKKIYLTSFGKTLYRKSIRLVEYYKDTLNTSSGNSKETLRIGVYESLLKYRLMDLISSFKSNHPNLDIIIKHGTCGSLRKDIRNGDLDITFQIEPTRDFVDLHSIVLCEEKFSLIYPKGESVKDSHTVYFTEAACSYRKLFEQYLDEEGREILQSMETGSVDLIKQYVGLGLGYSMVPSVTITNEDRTKLDKEDFKTKSKLFTQIVYHKDKNVFKAMKEFIEILKLEAEKWQIKKDG
jgi:DNA-binding transcriptional LysR family regulator